MAYRAVNRPQGLLDRLAPSAYGDRDQDQAAWPEQLRAEEQDLADRIVRTGELMASERPPSDAAVLDELDWYYQAASQYGAVNAELFNALGDLIAEDERSRSLFEESAEGLAGYLREAFGVYAQARLAEGGA